MAGVDGALQYHHPAVNLARAAQARASQGRVEDPQAQEIGGHQVLQEIGEVGVLQAHPAVRVEKVDQEYVREDRVDSLTILASIRIVSLNLNHLVTSFCV